MTLEISQIIEDIRDSNVVDTYSDLLLGVALAGEVGEFCNFLKKEHRKGGTAGMYQQDIEDELMDCLYYVVCICMARGVDIEKAWNRKMNHNEKKYGRLVKYRSITCDCGKCDKKK